MHTCPPDASTSQELVKCDQILMAPASQSLV